ncbi:MAG TPA: NAD(P)-dependent oxidoreductase [Thermoanaerobaculia bacterium]|nr:NAD(P)-dependent oxidoreductase [Thermoanaerobaculia bacterium]
MPKALLTGGTGFVGGHVALCLLNDGWSVRVLARDPTRSAGGLLDGVRARLEIHRGDLESEDGLEGAAAGVDAIVHAAGILKARSLEDYREVNVRGTERLLRAAARSAPSARLVLVSSQAAAGPTRDGRPVRESDPAAPISWYGLSKREGEEAVSRLWPGPWTVLRPGVVFGPGDRGLLAYFRMAATGFVPVPAGRSRVQLIAVERAALAIARAAQRPVLTGRIGFLCDPMPVTVRELAEKIAAGAGRPSRLVRVPDVAVRLLGLIDTLAERVTGKSRPFNADKAREILAGDWTCDGRPVDEALGLPAPRPLDDALRALWGWYRRAGWIGGTPS